MFIGTLPSKRELHGASCQQKAVGSKPSRAFTSARRRRDSKHTRVSLPSAGGAVRSAARLAVSVSD
eukprot:9686205-Alexandrium_andersonii.AAC.1